MLPYNPRLKQTARALRHGATFPERLLWSRLRRGGVGVRVLRQRPVGAYVVDFCAPDYNLLIEVDGRSHDQTGAADAGRQAWLESAGFTTLRFTNDEVLHDLEGTVARTAAWLHEHQQSN